MFDFIALALIRQFVKSGTLHIETRWGPSTKCKGDAPGPTSWIRITDRKTLWTLVFKPDLAFGEAYMDGRLLIVEGGLDALMEVLLTNQQAWSCHWAGRLTLGVNRTVAVLKNVNPRARSRRNVAHHYDLTDELFESFLDPWRQYSCAYFHENTTTLEDAQLTKIARLAAKLDLKERQNVLDIGCGWGGLSRALAQLRPWVNVTGITLSERQLSFARQAASQSSLEQQLVYELRDYRDQTGSFDRIVSVGMLEHVGPHNYRGYFDKIRELLTPDGVAVIHTIAVHQRSGPVNRWLTKYIFPGGHLPSIDQMVRATEAQGLKLLDMEVLRSHYAETLGLWRDRFLRHRDEMERLYDERFVRMWEFYLVGCEYFFRSQRGMVLQMVLATDHKSLPKSRHYVGEREKEFRTLMCQISPSGKQNLLPK